MSHPSPILPDGPIALIGFGEASQAFSLGWRGETPGLDIRAFDTKTQKDTTAAAKWANYADAQVTGCETLPAALDGAGVVFSLVTADQANLAAKSAAEFLQPGGLYFDGNSCAPGTKRASGEVIEAVGALYVDMAVMSPVHPKLHKAPVLICGPHCQAALPVLAGLGMMAMQVPGPVGRASSIKMMRSVMVKGLEALALECILSARKAGVDQEILASLDASFPGIDWPAKMAYDFERTTTHGRRRAAEMREVAKTVQELGLMNPMSQAIVLWQQTMGDLDLPPSKPDLSLRADAILAALEQLQTQQEKDD